MSTTTIDRTEATDVVEPITDATLPETEGVEESGETTPEESGQPVIVPESFATEELRTENAKLYKECVDLLRNQLIGETDRNLALGMRVWKLCEFQRNHAPKFEKQDVDRVCNNIWNMVALEISLPEKNHLDRCLAFYLFRFAASKELKLDTVPKRAKGERRKAILPYTVFDRHIFPVALSFDKARLEVTIKDKWFAWLKSLLLDILESERKFSRSDLDARVKAERERQNNEGKSPEQLEKEAEQADRAARKARRETIVKGFSTAVDKAVKDELFSATQLVDELVAACRKAEMEGVPTVGGCNPATMRTEDVASLVGVLVHFRKIDVMTMLRDKLSAEIAKIQGS